MPLSTSLQSGIARRVDRLGALLGVGAIVAAVTLPFVVHKANRIASGTPRSVLEALPRGTAVAALALVAGVAASAALSRRPRLRLAAAVAGVTGIALALGRAADVLTPAGNRLTRVSPGVGCWLLLVLFALLATDALARLRPGPAERVGCLALTALAAYAAFASGLFDHLSIMREYAVNASGFGREARQHVLLALGSVGAAAVIGLPVGILCHRVPRLRGAILQALNLIQTIPSIALFGILMVPLGALATAVPLAAELGINGIGPAPAAVALFLYALLPIVANTSVGLGRVSPAAVDAARGMGLTDWQVLSQIEMPLALPVIITGLRIVLVQNIGLVTVAALIGGGGFGTYVFQGVGQTAIDLVLLGAIPTVALAFTAAVLLDALVDALQRTAR